jgi:zinc transport system substrate-binding protein
MIKKLMVVAILFTFIACNNTNKSEKQSGKDVVTVSILPEKTFVHKIAGEDFDVNVLIPPGASPASYTLLPSQLKDISKSSIWFRMGYIGFEHSWKDKIAQANEEMKVVNVAEGLDLIASEIVQHGDHVHIDGVDPHVWLSPTLVKQISKRILDELTILKPEKAADYKANYMRFVKECDELNIELMNKLKPYKGRKFIVFHPSLSYYAREYGLEQFSLESGGKEPTPQHLKMVVDMAKKEDIKVIYIQSEFDREHARVFADEIEGKIVEVWPLNPEWKDNLLNMTDILISNF